MTPAFIRHAEVAKRLGFSPSRFSEIQSALQAEGFPRPDPLLKRYHREDVEAWIKGRRKLADPDTVTAEAPFQINYDAL